MDHRDYLVNLTEGKKFSWFNEVMTDLGDEAEEVNLNITEEWLHTCNQGLQHVCQELRAKNAELAAKMEAVERGKRGDLDEGDEPLPVHEKFVPWHKQMRGKKLTPMERECMDQLGKKAVPKRRMKRD